MRRMRTRCGLLSPSARRAAGSLFLAFLARAGDGQSWRPVGPPPAGIPGRPLSRQGTRRHARRLREMGELGMAVLSDDGRCWPCQYACRRHRGTRSSCRRSTSIGRRSGNRRVPETVLCGAGSRAPPSRPQRMDRIRISVSEAEREKLQEEKKPVRDSMDCSASTRRRHARARRPAGRDALGLRRPLPTSRFTATCRGLETQGRRPARSQPRHGRDDGLRQRGRVRLAGQGRLLAFTIDAEGKAGNGVQVFDPQTGLLRLLDSGERCSPAWPGAKKTTISRVSAPARTTP